MSDDFDFEAKKPSAYADEVYAEEGYVKVIVNKKVFRIKLLSTTNGLNIINRMTKLFLPLMGSWMDSGRREGLILPEDDEAYTTIALLLVSKLDDFAIVKVIKALLYDLKLEDETVDYETYFRANYGELALLVESSLRENKLLDFFTDFLKSKGVDLQKGLEDLKTTFEKKTQKPQEEDYSKSEED